MRKRGRPRQCSGAQSDTEDILGSAVRERGGSIEWNTELLGLAQEQSGVLATLKLLANVEGRVACDWLVSCEGAHSVARKAVGIQFVGKTYPLSFLMADVELHGDIAAGENHVCMHPDGSFAARTHA